MQITPKKILDNLSLMDKSALILFSEANADPIYGRTAYEKELFFIAENNEDIKDAAEFEPYLYGPHSDSAENSLSNLISYGLVRESNGFYSITESGKEISSMIKDDPQGIDVEHIDEIKKVLNNFSTDEILLFTYVLHPEYTSESIKKDTILRKRIPVSVSLYKNGKVGLEMAAHLAGLNIEDFLEKMRRHKQI